jgi:2-dehydropantoate 2-reductase
MRIAVFGAGSIGGYVGGTLAARGARVTLVDGWSAHVETIRRDGLRLIERGRETAVAVDAMHLHDVHAMRSPPVDVVILSVKSYDTAWMTTLAREAMGPDSVVVSLQNGINEDTISAVVGPDRVVGCTLARLGAELLAPGRIRRTLFPPFPGYPVFRVGKVDGSPSARARDVAAVLGEVDSAQVTSNLAGERWSKLTQNAMASGLSPLANVGLKRLFHDPDYARLVCRIACEGIRTGRALGLDLVKICAVEPDAWLEAAASPAGFESLQRALEPWRRDMEEATEASTLHDIRRGRRTEIESINGLIARKAAERGVDAPLNDALTRAVLGMEREAPHVRPLDKERLFRLLEEHAPLSSTR